jgi:hypothetical protein
MKLKLSKFINFLIKLLYIGAGLIVIILGLASLIVPVLPGFLFIFFGFSILSRGTSRFDKFKTYFSFNNFFNILKAVLLIFFTFFLFKNKKKAAVLAEE